MTYVGKILVMVIMVCSLLFLGISTVVFTTATNWKKEAEEQKKKAADLTQKTKDAEQMVQGYTKLMADSKSEHESADKRLEDRIAALEAEIKRAQTEATQARSVLGIAQQNAKSSLDEAAAHKQETDLLRNQKLAVEKQANDYKLRQTELNDKIRELTRMYETATRNANDLRDRVARFSTLLRRNGLSDDISQVKGIESPPAVEGEIARVDKDNRRVEITIGADEGLVVGNELYVFRTKPRPEYLGKITVISVDPDQAVAKVIGQTVHGKKLKEGDIVSTTIRPRS
jgi:hypothetical protein